MFLEHLLAYAATQLRLRCNTLSLAYATTKQVANTTLFPPLLPLLARRQNQGRQSLPIITLHYPSIPFITIHYRDNGTMGVRKRGTMGVLATQALRHRACASERETAPASQREAGNSRVCTKQRQ